MIYVVSKSEIDFYPEETYLNCTQGLTLISHNYHVLFPSCEIGPYIKIMLDTQTCINIEDNVCNKGDLTALAFVAFKKPAE